MGRLAWSQVRCRPARTLALIVGVLVAATAFTVLTAASRTGIVITATAALLRRLPTATLVAEE
jgi:hypothetical protein